MTRSFIDGNGGSSSNGLIQEQLVATVWPNAMDTSAPATMKYEENLKARIYDLERKLNGKEEEITKAKVEASEEIQRLNSELDTMRILHNTKEKQIRRSKRRSKLRIYLPDANKP